MDNKTLLRTECRFAIHIPETKSNPDTHIVKVNEHYSDGTNKRKIKLIKNYKRPFYITDPQYRTYRQKKEFEYINRCSTHYTTQTYLKDNVAKALGVHTKNTFLRKLSDSPYLYGTEITSSSLLKHEINSKDQEAGHTATPYSVSFFDTETDVINGTDETIIVTQVFENEIYAGVVKAFIAPHTEEEFMNKFNYYLSPLVNNLNEYVVTFRVFDTVIELLRDAFLWLHKLKPDIVAIWNMDYDIPMILKVLNKYNVDPKTILCDPGLPNQLKVCEYYPGSAREVKASKEQSIKAHDRWNWLQCSAGFQIIDSMCAYRRLRITAAKDPEYNLNYILNKELGIRKLNFEEASTYHKLEWHKFMQRNYKLEYLCYAIFDSLSMKLLDDKTFDLKTTLPLFSGSTSFRDFKSKNKTIGDVLHHTLLKDGKALCSLSNNLDLGFDESDDEETLSLNDWIMLLDPYSADPGLNLIKENNKIKTNIRTHAYDIDATSAYPRGASVLNLSKETTRFEIANIEGIPEETFRLQNINIAISRVNSVEYCSEMHNLPTCFDLLND